ncbi:MAG: 4'-phosphopantetheinyl transferase superfamily protein [Bacteroidaceae bacterium]|nr:4'-phosphopantetheinyl transferase superfamily protein [Bacteroidaceae bacterium]
MILIDDQIQEYTPEEIARWTDELPEWRRKQVLAYKNDMGRRQSLLAYRLLCQGLREEYGIMEQPTFVYNEHGKPSLALPPTGGDGEGLYFSLSHCKEGVCCAISDRPVGIDIESANRKISDSVIRYSMNEGEQALIRESDDPQRTFLRLWTQKEAVLKRLGTGIRDDMRDILSDHAYTIEVRENERYILSVAW